MNEHNDYTLPHWLENYLDEIDAAVFTGDSFQMLDERLERLQFYINRWQKHINGVREQGA